MKIFCRKYFFTYLLLLSYMFFIACKREDNSPSTGEAVGVEISVSGINNTLFQTASSQPTTKASAKSSASNTAEHIEKFDNFSWSLTAGEDEIASPATKATASPSKKAVSMQTGKKYRILFYEVNGANEIFRASEEITASSSRYLMKLAPNITYKWYAYSYDDTGSIPLPTNTSDPQIETRIDAPFLFDQGTVTTSPAAEHRVDIEFEHQITKVEVKVDALQVYANNFVSLAANFVQLPLSTSAFSLKGGTLNPTILSSTDYNGSVLFANDGSLAIQKSTNVLYTSTVLSHIDVKFTEITINKSGTNVELVNSSAPKTAAVGGFGPEVNKLKRAVIYLKYKGGVIQNGEWAQGILYYDPTDPANPYKISEPFMVGQTHDCNYYWNWNSLLPRSITKDANPNPGDPCGEVLPKGTWRTPTKTDFLNLNIAHANNPVNGAVYFDADNGERVYFHEAGWVTTSNSCIVGNTNDGIYWSSDSYNTNWAWTLEIDERGGTGVGNQTVYYLKDAGMTVKCIKNK